MAPPVMTIQLLYTQLHEIYRETLHEHWVNAACMIDNLIIDMGESKLMLLLPDFTRKSMMVLHKAYKELSVKNYQQAHMSLHKLYYEIKKYEVYEEVSSI
jgi:hypothetical protein